MVTSIYIDDSSEDDQISIDESYSVIYEPYFSSDFLHWNILIALFTEALLLFIGAILFKEIFHETYEEAFLDSLSAMTTTCLYRESSITNNCIIVIFGMISFPLTLASSFLHVQVLLPTNHNFHPIYNLTLFLAITLFLSAAVISLLFNVHFMEAFYKVSFLAMTYDHPSDMLIFETWFQRVFIAFIMVHFLGLYVMFASIIIIEIKNFRERMAMELDSFIQSTFHCVRNRNTLEHILLDSPSSYEI